ncbi:hypothetical protein [Clostridium aciditolerans]|uniref:Uncharacterized protein n=1 Tax=Clostridium aciditolerans TaxID=339861 RepID=A0A934I2L7_9CLOT|nr:hypothetical protein [Clostridium aciditolerans]MBI6875153.1 hypothetical protein [Clostridium aciditolerans]
MHILDNHLSPSTRTIMENIMLSEWSKSAKINIPIETKEKDELNIKASTARIDMNVYKEKDIFKEHLMSNIW